MPISCLWGWPPPLAWLLMNLALQEGREVEVAKNRGRNKEKRVGMRRRVGTRSSHRWPSAWPLSPCLPCTQADKIGTGFLPSAYQKQVIFKTKQNKTKSKALQRVRTHGCELHWVNVVGKKSVLSLQPPVRAQSSDVKLRFDKRWRHLKRLCHLPHFYFPGGCMMGPGLSAEPLLAFSVPFAVWGTW